MAPRLKIHEASKRADRHCSPADAGKYIQTALESAGVEQSCIHSAVSASELEEEWEVSWLQEGAKLKLFYLMREALAPLVSQLHAFITQGKASEAGPVTVEWS